MSGRPKGPVMTSAEEAREATRELHAAIKDARALIKELQEGHDALHAMLSDLGPRWTAHMNDQAHAAVQRYIDQADANYGDIADAVAEFHLFVKDAEMRMAGFTDHKAAMSHLAEYLGGLTTGMMADPVFVDRLAARTVALIEEKSSDQVIEIARLPDGRRTFTFERMSR